MITGRRMEDAGDFQGKEPFGDIQAFACSIKQRLELAHPTASVELHEVQKNNSLNLTGVVIREKGRNIAPTIYLNNFFEQYRNGQPLDEICQIIEEVHQRANPGRNFDAGILTEFPAVRDKICYKLVNAEKNAGRLKMVPHRLWLDLAVVYYIPLSLESVGGVSSSISVDNNMLEMWGADEPELYRHASTNTPALFPAEIMSVLEVMDNILKGMAGMEAEMFAGMLKTGNRGNRMTLYSASNEQHIDGAAVMMYDGILEKFAEKVKGDFYILPSSVNETLFLPVPPGTDGRGLPEMVRDINAGCLDPEEVLSDNAYRYYAEDGCVRLVV